MITSTRLKELVLYDSKTGTFCNRIDRHGSPKGKKLGYHDTRKCSGYVFIWLDSKRYSAHRLAWLYTYGEFPKGNIDHINRVRHDNSIDNLRIRNPLKNSWNRTKAENKTSKYLGVSFKKGRKKCWTANIQVDGKNKFLGSFKDEENASKAYKEAVKLYRE